MNNPATQRNPTYAEFDRVLAAGEETSIAVAGDFAICVEATFEFKIGFNDGPKTNFRKGFRFGFGASDQIETVQLLNNSGSSMTITLGVGRGDVRDARLVLPSGGIETTRPDVFSTWSHNLAATSGLFLLSANPSRFEAFFCNDGAATFYVNHGWSQKRGVMVMPGGTQYLGVTAALYVYNPSALAIDVCYGETSFS